MGKSIQFTFGALLLSVVAAAASAPAASELSRQAVDLYNQARFTEAEPLFRRALESWARQHGRDAAIQRAIVERELGSLLQATARYAEAEKLLAASLSDFNSLGTKPEATYGLLDMANLYRLKGDLAEAERFALEGLSMAREAGSESALRSAQLVVGAVYVSERRFAEAEAMLNPLMKTADALQAMVAYTNLTSVAIARGEFEQAEEVAKQALQLAKLAFPAGHPTVAAAWNNLAQACRFHGDYLEAENAYRKAIAIWEDTLGPWHPQLAIGLVNFAAFYHDRGREAGAEDLYLRAAAILERSFGKGDPRTLAARNELADVLRAERRYAEAGKLGRTTLTALEKQLPPDDPRVERAKAYQTLLSNETRRLKEYARVSGKPKLP